MAVLARALGYPARVAVGFTPGRFDPTLHAWRVSTANAHAWVEVLFPGFGWLAFEPTPTRSNPVADSYLAPLSQTGACQLHGRCTSRQRGTGKKTGAKNDARSKVIASREQGQGGGPAVQSTTPTGTRSHLYRLPLFLLAILLLLALSALLVVAPLAKVLVRRGRLARAGPPREVVLAAFRTFSGQAADLGMGRADGETLREYRDRLETDVAFSDGHLQRLTDLAAAAAYSDHDLSKEQAKEALGDARQAIRDIRRQTPAGRRLVGTFRPGL
jgi:hypothetical protein